jgi:hypothetical protein
MGWIGVLLGSLAAIIFFFVSNHIMLCIIALLITMGCFWSWGVMHNYATEMAKRRLNYTGQFFDITPEDTHAVPDWITRINMAFTIGAIIIFLLSIFEKNTLHIIVVNMLNIKIIATVSVIIIVECFCAYAAYFIIRKIFRVQALKVLAVAVSLLGLIIGWTAAYRVAKDSEVQAYYNSANNHYKHVRGSEMSGHLFIRHM